MKGESMARKIMMMAFAISLILTIPLGLQAQTTGKVEGTIRDADTGEPLVGAQITVEGTLLGNITNEDGYFFILNVPAGLRNVKTQLIGYQSVTVADQRVLAGHTHTVNFELNSTVIELPGQVVKGEKSPLVPRDNTVSKHRVTFESAQALPADNYRDIITLQAGIVRYGDAANSAYQISVRGGRTSENAVYIDGINVRRYTQDTNPLDVPEYGVEEIDVITGGYGSQFGDAQSGVINIVTREGGTKLNGQLRVETDEFNPSSTNYGYSRGQFSLGGPIPGIDNLSFFFSSDVVGKGDSRPRASGFKGNSEDLFEVAERFSNNDEVRDFLGSDSDLDIFGMLNEASQTNPNLPILNFSMLRKMRFHGFTQTEFDELEEEFGTDEAWSRIRSKYGEKTDYEGRLPGNQSNEFRIQAKIAYQPTRNVKLIATYLEDRDQGLSYGVTTGRRRMFWTEERNRAQKNQNRLGILGYDQTLSQSAERSSNISVRASFQHFERNTGDIWAPFDSTSTSFNHWGPDPANPGDSTWLSGGTLGFPGGSLGYHDQRSILNFMFSPIPILGEDFYPRARSQYVKFTGVEQGENTNGDNPFGLRSVYWDENDGLVNLVYNNREDRANFRFDFDSQLNRIHRLRAGGEFKMWWVDTFSGDYAAGTFKDYSNARPDMESFYIEDRLDYQDLVIDLGLRYDSFYAGTDYASIFGDQTSPRVKPTRKNEFSPRLGVAHPVTDRTQVRVSYGTKYQVPQFSNLFDAINVNLADQGNSNAFFGNPNMGFRKTTSFEVGFTTLLSENWVLDLVGYNRDFHGNVSARYLKQEGSRYLRIYANADHGNVRGMDTTLRKRFTNYFSTDFTYTLLFSKSTGTDPDDFVRNEGRNVISAGEDDTPPLPPINPAPNDFDQTHTFNALFNLQFPRDFREGTMMGKILKETAVNFTMQANSGRPFTRQDEEYTFIEDINLSRRGWQSLANLRVTKDFQWGGLEYTAFADIRNLFDTDNLSANNEQVFNSSGVSNGVYQTTGNPYTDGNTVNEAIERMLTPDLWVSVNDRELDKLWDINSSGGLPDEVDRTEIIRRLDMNGDGIVTIEEEFAMQILAQGAFDANPYNFDIPRLFRLGLEIKF
jgi:outer membrane receptor protein involved in Fe transport